MPEDKKIDESWKDAVEKERSSSQKDDELAVPEPDFPFFLTTLALQAGIFLGEITNPSNNQKEENLAQAKFIIDTLSMLKEKTAGNLSAEEDSMLDNILYDLRTKYINKVNRKPSQA
ncbi:MAG: DUF1844 domain-containing protein [Candidatus Omnitrophota bacterium]|nr:DUF1844 domain-containing protein [Candidatus Omnitrophota bacterium]